MARVLVIDDDKLFVELMVDALEERGHVVTFAFDGHAGLREFAASKFDAVVCDLVMPEQEGVETIRLLRRQAAGVGIVAISSGLRSSASSLDILHFASRFGADVTLKKPFKLSQLVAAVDEAMSLSSKGLTVGTSAAAI